MPCILPIFEALALIALAFVLWDLLLGGPDEPIPIYATLTFKGVIMATIRVGKTATAVFAEFDANGVAVPPVTPPVFTSSDPTVATVDSASGVVTGVAAGTATITGTDSGDNLSASDSLPVTDPAVSATLVITAN